MQGSRQQKTSIVTMLTMPMRDKTNSNSKENNTDNSMNNRIIGSMGLDRK